jgi:hypothetical protein
MDIQLKDETILDIHTDFQCDVSSNEYSYTFGYGDSYTSMIDISFYDSDIHARFESSHQDGLDYGTILKFFANLDFQELTIKEFTEKFIKVIEEAVSHVSDLEMRISFKGELSKIFDDIKIINTW